MKNVFLHNFPEQCSATLKQFEQRISIPFDQYLQYQKVALPINNTDAVHLFILSNKKGSYLNAYSVQLE